MRLTALIDANALDLLNYFARRVNAFEDAADLVSDTMLAAWRHIGALPADEEQARMWMFGTANRVLANYHRSKHRKTALAARLRSELAHQYFNNGVGDSTEEFEDVRLAVADLPDGLREIVGLVHWEGFSLVESAAILDLSPSTVRSRYAKARAVLMTSLESRLPIGSPQSETRRSVAGVSNSVG